MVNLLYDCIITSVGLLSINVDGKVESFII